MLSEHHDFDYRLFQDRQRDFEKAADMERRIHLCEQKHTYTFVQPRHMTRLGNALQFVYRVIFERHPDTTQVGT